MTRSGLHEFIAAAPWPQRAALRTLLALVCRPRGAALLAHSPLAGQLAASLRALGHYDEPAVARALGLSRRTIYRRLKEYGIL